MSDLEKLELPQIEAEIKALQAEVKRREKIAEEKRRELRREKNLKILAAKDTLLSLMEHGRTSCSDANPVNGKGSGDGYPRCNKCAIMDLNEWNLEDTEILIDFTIRYPY